MSYRIEKNGVRTAWQSDLKDCLYNIAIQMTSFNLWKTITVAQACAAGYRIVKVEGK